VRYGLDQGLEWVVGGMAPVWYRPVRTLLVRRRRPIGEPAPTPDAALVPDTPFTLLDGTAGAGRIVAALVELGVQLGDVRQAVIDPDGPPEALDRSTAEGVFDVVVLGSHLLNNPDPDRRIAFLRLGGRHLAQGGRMLVEHHPLDWAETAEATRPTPGATLGMVDVRRDPPFVSAVSVYDAGGRIVRQPFTARVLSEAELDEALAAGGLTRERRIGPTWLEARHRSRPGA
jgi:nucleotide-binding universal stress UspA family protein